ncbi:hypothetical protein [Taibaiella koreensis]|uniref:hypothetical protein n=1 Tax=Taibaiella koreensis TaxID=1268548 RepID=UPI000E5A0288|nr:hypothetical protein [Taibaiella koreensis]
MKRAYIGGAAAILVMIPAVAGALQLTDSLVAVLIIFLVVNALLAFVCSPQRDTASVGILFMIYCLITFLTTALLLVIFFFYGMQYYNKPG